MSNINQIYKNNNDCNVSTQSNEKNVMKQITLIPEVDIYENNKEIILWADLPGVNKDKLHVNIHDGNLSIEGESIMSLSKNLRSKHTEMYTPYFTRTFAISSDFNTSKIEAVLNNGVLKLTIPRRDEAKPRKIEVK